MLSHGMGFLWNEARNLHVIEWFFVFRGVSIRFSSVISLNGFSMEWHEKATRIHVILSILECFKCSHSFWIHLKQVFALGLITVYIQSNLEFFVLQEWKVVIYEFQWIIMIKLTQAVKYDEGSGQGSVTTHLDFRQWGKPAKTKSVTWKCMHIYITFKVKCRFVFERILYFLAEMYIYRGRHIHSLLPCKVYFKNMYNRRNNLCAMVTSTCLASLSALNWSNRRTPRRYSCTRLNKHCQ